MYLPLPEFDFNPRQNHRIIQIYFNDITIQLQPLTKEDIYGKMIVEVAMIMEIKNIFEAHFSVIEDTRCQCDVKHKLIDVLILIVCAVLCNKTEAEEIVDYGICKAEFLEEYFGITKIPSKSTIIRILNMVNAEVVSLCTVNIMRELFGTGGNIVAIDGKTICSTAKMKSYKEKLHIMTAYMTENGVSLGQLSVGDKTNEIPCMIELLDLINVENKIITADAMHCQKKTAEKIRETKCDYVLCVKGNQPTLHADISLYIEDLKNSRAKSDKEKYITACTTEKNKSRYEKRTCYLINDISWLESRLEWKDLKSIFAVERIVKENDKTSIETSYYISSLEAAPERFLEIVREHWQVESMHYILDVVMSEDECRLYSANAQKAMNVFRKLSVAMHKNYITKMNSKISMRRNMNRCSMDDNLLIAVIEAFV